MFLGVLWFLSCFPTVSNIFLWLHGSYCYSYVKLCQEETPFHAEARIRVMKYSMNMRKNTAPNRREKHVGRKGTVHFWWQALYFGKTRLVRDGRHVTFWSCEKQGPKGWFWWQALYSGNTGPFLMVCVTFREHVKNKAQDAIQANHYEGFEPHGPKPL